MRKRQILVPPNSASTPKSGACTQARGPSVGRLGVEFLPPLGGGLVGGSFHLLKGLLVAVQMGLHKENKGAKP